MWGKWILGLSLVGGPALAGVPSFEGEAAGSQGEKHSDEQVSGGETVESTAIVNGSETTDFEAVVALGYLANNGGGGRVFCSGTLVSTDWVVTAAHCVTNIQQYKNAGFTPTVFFGGNLYEGVDDAIEFVEWVPHPRYSGGGGSLQYDIAMIRLKTPKTDVIFAFRNYQW